MANWFQTMLEWSLGRPLLELCLIIPPAILGVQYQSVVLTWDPMWKNVLKIFSSENAWSFGTNVWANGP